MEFARAGKAIVFEALRGYLSGELETSYAETGYDVGMSESAVKVTVHRLRRRLAQKLRNQILQTVQDPGDVEGEMRNLFHLVGS